MNRRDETLRGYRSRSRWLKLTSWCHRLEPPKEVKEGVHNLLGEARAYLVLIPAAVRQQRRQTMLLRPCQQALFTQEKA